MPSTRNKQRICLYPGSFDPITNGHLALISRARRCFDKVLVGVLHHPGKRCLFDVEERMDMIQQALREQGLEDCVAVTFSGLAVELAAAQGAMAIVRGLRTAIDFEYEAQLAAMNKKLAPDIDTVFWMADAQYAHIHSSVVKELAYYGRDVSDFAPGAVVEQLQKKYNETGKIN